MVHQDDNTPTNTTTATSPIRNGDDVDTASKQLQQLDQLHAVIQMEHELTSWIERVRPWIQSSDRTQQHTHGACAGDVNSSNSDSNYDDSIYSNMCRVRPIPTTMGQVHDILCVARSYANRTSAPPGWIPTAPVLNFSTPNPLPHQLRHGALAALQLQRALQQQQQQAEAEAAAVRKRKIQQAAVEQEAAVADRIAAELAHNKLQNNNNHSSAEPQHPASAKTQLQQHHHVPTVVVPQQPKRPRQDITMNLSDSSSSDDEDEDDDDE
jgi:hypothetical protein